MIKFKSLLESLGTKYLLDVPNEEDIDFYNKDKLYSYLNDIVYNKRTVFVYGDYDVDGLCSAINWGLALNKLGHRKYAFYKYKNRTHKIDKEAIVEAIQMKCDYMIINDAGSSDLQSINILLNNGIKVILLDHHVTPFKDYKPYHSSVCIINTTIENSILGMEKYKCCTGALVYLAVKDYLEDRGINTVDMSVYALGSLYADCMDMTNNINRSVYYTAMKINNYNIPEYVKVFMNRYTQLSRRFFEYSWSPKINAAFRSEQFKYINDTMLYPNPFYSSDDIMNIFKGIQDDARDLVNTISDIIYFEDKKRFVIGNLNSVNSYMNVYENKLFNYTGLIANKLSSKCNKPGIVLCYTGNGYKGSFRDRSSRNYLKLFKTFCNAEGHAPAFGINLEKNEYNKFMRSIDIIDSYGSEELDNIQQPILTDLAQVSEVEEVYEMAKYNEFSGGKVPKAYLHLLIGNDLEELRNNYNGYKYKYKCFTIYSPRRLIKGDTVTINPYLVSLTNYHLEVV